MPEYIENEISAALKTIAELPESFEITPRQSLKADLGIDSLKLIDVVVRVEAALDIEMGDDFAHDVITVEDLQRYVTERAGT